MSLVEKCALKGIERYPDGQDCLKKRKAQAGVKHLEPEGHLCGQGLARGEGKELRSQTLEIESNSVGSRSQ